MRSFVPNSEKSFDHLLQEYGDGKDHKKFWEGVVVPINDIVWDTILEQELCRWKEEKNLVASQYDGWLAEGCELLDCVLHGFVLEMIKCLIVHGGWVLVRSWWVCQFLCLVPWVLLLLCVDPTHWCIDPKVCWLLSSDESDVFRCCWFFSFWFLSNNKVGAVTPCATFLFYMRSDVGRSTSPTDFFASSHPPKGVEDPKDKCEP